jgi:hypothetical protein
MEDQKLWEDILQPKSCLVIAKINEQLGIPAGSHAKDENRKTM